MALKHIRINKTLIVEFISVTFAVFLGLMMSQRKDTRNHNQLAKQSKNRNYRQRVYAARNGTRIIGNLRLSKLLFDTSKRVYEKLQLQPDKNHRKSIVNTNKLLYEAYYSYERKSNRLQHNPFKGNWVEITE